MDIDYRLDMKLKEDIKATSQGTQISSICETTSTLKSDFYANILKMQPRRTLTEKPAFCGSVFLNTYLRML